MQMIKMLTVAMLLCSMHLNAFWPNLQRAFRPTYALLQNIRPQIRYFALGTTIVHEVGQHEQACTQITTTIEDQLLKLAFMAELDDTPKAAELKDLVALYAQRLDTAQHEADAAQRLASLTTLLKYISQH